MGKKKKSTPSSAQTPSAPAAPEPKPQQSGEPGGDIFSLMARFVRQPKLVVAAFSLAMALFSAAGMIRFRNDYSMGAVREPTGLVMWTAITLTLLASYMRDQNRKRDKSES